MNELIRKLAEQACFLNKDEESVEYFAELIVRKCCDIFVELRTRPADLAVKDVKKHFGVEE